MKLDKTFWNDKYINKKTPWDVGCISEPIKVYFDSVKNKSLSILIPGAGNAHEAIYLRKMGFKNVHICDWSQNAIKSFKENNPSFPEAYIHCDDFFTHKGQYDIIIEQTFYCALNPDDGPKYAQKVNDLLKTNGYIVGLFFNENMGITKPPFGLKKEAYMGIFNLLFNIKVLELCYNSIAPRKGNELFIIFIKK